MRSAPRYYRTMNQIPPYPKIYHITHLKNLPAILQNNGLHSDAKCLELGLGRELVGLSTIKARRLYQIEVKCNPGSKVGEYVPFNFCPRSVMLYILHKGNLPDLSYRDGQGPIVHLQADIQNVIRKCTKKGTAWAFSDRNAGSFLARFYNRQCELDNINWNAVDATDFSNATNKESKQAEFLVKDFFPWQWIEKIGVINLNMKNSVNKILLTAGQTTPLAVERSWYF